MASFQFLAEITAFGPLTALCQFSHYACLGTRSEVTSPRLASCPSKNRRFSAEIRAILYHFSAGNEVDCSDPGRRLQGSQGSGFGFSRAARAISGHLSSAPPAGASG